MEKARFKEAKKQVEIIDACEDVLSAKDEQNGLWNLIYKKDPDGLIFKLLSIDKQVERSFIRWVANEKEIAEQKFKEI